MERENIFSWRGELRNKTPEQKVKFYYNKLTNDFKIAVLMANTLAEKRNYEPLEIILKSCSSEERQKALENKLVKRMGRQSDQILYRARKDIHLGFAGLFRVEHTYANSMAKRTQEMKPHIERAHLVYQRHETTDSITLFIHRTIHGAGINWEAEKRQDLANTYLISGDKNAALAVLSEGVVILNDNIENIERENSLSESRLIDYAGMLSGRGLMRVRISKVEMSLKQILMGVKDINEAAQIQRNYDRVKVVNWWLIQAAYTHKGNILQRGLALWRGTKNLAINWIVNETT